MLKYADTSRDLPLIVTGWGPWKSLAFARYFGLNILRKRNHLEDNCYLCETRGHNQQLDLYSAFEKTGTREAVVSGGKIEIQPGRRRWEMSWTKKIRRLISALPKNQP